MHHASELIRAVASLAWPIVAIVIVLIFRRQIASLLTQGVRRVKAGPFSVVWDRQVSEVETELDQPGIPRSDAGPRRGPVSEALAGVAQASPIAAVMEAHARVERELRELLKGADTPAPLLRTGAAGLARAAMDRGLLTQETARAVEGLSILRNLAAHGRAEEVSAERATDYLLLADAVLFALGHRPGGLEPRL